MMRANALWFVDTRRELVFAGSSGLEYTGKFRPRIRCAETLLENSDGTATCAELVALDGGARIAEIVRQGFAYKEAAACVDVKVTLGVGGMHCVMLLEGAAVDVSQKVRAA